MKVKFFILLMGIAFSSYSKPGWKTTIDKKANPVTGFRNAYLEKDADGLSIATLLFGCTDGKPVLRIAENFSLANAIDDAVFKSKLQQSLQQGLEYQQHGFRFSVKDGQLFTRIKLRIDSEPEYFDAEVPMGYNNGFYFAILEGSHSELIPRLLNATKVVAELPYKRKPGFATWTMEGVSTALDAVRQAGCVLPR